MICKCRSLPREEAKSISRCPCSKGLPSAPKLRSTSNPSRDSDQKQKHKESHKNKYSTGVPTHLDPSQHRHLQRDRSTPCLGVRSSRSTTSLKRGKAWSRLYVLSALSAKRRHHQESKAILDDATLIPFGSLGFALVLEPPYGVSYGREYK